MNDHLSNRPWIYLAGLFTLGALLAAFSVDWAKVMNWPTWIQAIGSVVAIFAAVGIAFFERRRTEKIVIDQKINKKEKLISKQMAARAVLASDLSFIISYTKDSVEAVILGNRINSGLEIKAHIDYPKLDTDILLRLQSLAEILDKNDADQIIDLMHMSQIMYAKMSTILDQLNALGNTGHTWILNRSNFVSVIDSIVELNQRASILFSFARPSQHHISPPPFEKRQVNLAITMLDLDARLHKNEVDKIVNKMVNMPSLGKWRTE